MKTAPRALALNVLLSGLFHYLNNEVMFLALDNVHPITLAVGNTAKRVFIIVASLVRFALRFVSCYAGLSFLLYVHHSYLLPCPLRFVAFSHTLPQHHTFKTCSSCSATPSPPRAPSAPPSESWACCYTRS